MSAELVKYNAMLRAIQAAHSLDEILPIRTLAAQLKAAAKIAGNLEAERQCREIRLRAERRADELSKKIEKAPAARGNQYKEANPHNAEQAKASVLENIGISTQQASEWERLAAMPEDEFEASLRTRGASARTIINDYEARHRPAEAAINEVLRRIVYHIKQAENELVIFENSDSIRAELGGIRLRIADCKLTETKTPCRQMIEAARVEAGLVEGRFVSRSPVHKPYAGDEDFPRLDFGRHVGCARAFREACDPRQDGRRLVYHGNGDPDGQELPQDRRHAAIDSILDRPRAAPFPMRENIEGRPPSPADDAP
jgi:hypothetical protein